jgi:hypothetical protein
MASIQKLIDVSTILPNISQARRNFANVIFIQSNSIYTTGDVRSYSSASEVASDLGSNSEAYKASVKFFSGGFNGLTPNIFYVGLINTSDTVASTQGYFTSGDVSANLANFQAVNDGMIKITVDEGTAITINNIDFTAVTSFSDITSILQSVINLSGIRNVIVSYDLINNNFIFNSLTYGSNSKIILDSATGSGTDLIGANYLNGGTETDGIDGTQADAINIFITNDIYYHIILSNQFSQTQALEWVSSIEASNILDYMLWIQSNDTNIETTNLNSDTGTIALQLYNGKIKKTVLTYADDLTQYTEVYGSSYFAITDFTEARPLGCLAYKIFSGLNPSNITDTYWDNLTSKNVNFYGSYGRPGFVCMQQGKVPAGNFINDVIASDWMSYDISYNIFNWMTNKHKVRYTSQDFSELYQVIEQTFISAVSFLEIAPGTDPDTGENLVNGYKIVIPDPATISSADKSTGLLKNIVCTALLSGNVIKIVITNYLKI